MWQIKNSTIQPATLDFSSSGQGKHQVSQLFVGDLLLINALELVDWSREQTQFLICQACGFTGCKSGDWVSLRVAGELILILPAIAAWFGDQHSTGEYDPPEYVRNRGIPYFTIAEYEQVRSLHTAFPAVDKLCKLRLKEAIWAFQLEAPRRMFGNPPEKLSARKEMIIGASEGDIDEHLRYIEAFAQTYQENESPVEVRLPKATETIISFYLDTREFIEWKVLVRDGAHQSLMLNSEFVIAFEK